MPFLREAEWLRRRASSYRVCSFPVWGVLDVSNGSNAGQGEGGCAGSGTTRGRTCARLGADADGCARREGRLCIGSHGPALL